MNLRQKHVLTIALLAAVLLLVTACAPAPTPEPAAEPSEAPAPSQSQEEKTWAGTYVGYSWKDEAKGTSFDDTNEYIETILVLDDAGIITDAKMTFFVLKDGYWIPRSSGNAYVNVNFNVDPVAATPGDDYKKGTSMFTVYTADMMSFYASAVNAEGTVAVGLVDPVTRYLYESKFTADFDFSTPVGEITVGSGLLVPTTRTSAGGLMKPASWDELEDKNFFNIDIWSHVVNDVGELQDIDETSTVQEFLEALGVEFVDGVPQEMGTTYGYFGLGGWKGNHDAIAHNLIGQDATQLTSLIDWTQPRYAGAVNEENIFGVDVESGATRTVQNSYDGISGATVRVSRESTSYQKALVNAGIISEDDVILGRF